MQELPKAFSPKEVEDKWYSYWDDHDFFRADNTSKKEPFCIILPPPNVTGVLHMGHALGTTLQDIVIRYKRMKGYEVLWVPGTDHAGISTQTVVEKFLIEKYGKRRQEYEREEFLKHVWAWKDEKEERILNQIQKIGASCDWTRLRFTMDDRANRTVRTVFKKMYDDGLIYQGDYLVNWDPVTQTALADDEVEFEERDSFLWYFRYPLSDDKKDFIIIATTRPETILGDTAVAVAPKDARFASYVGRTLLLPLTNRKIPIIEDAYVDPEFGSGAVKITPAHDPNDYQIGLKANLPLINIMTPDGRINENGKEFQGMTMLEARAAVVAKMQSLGLLVKIEPYTLKVGLSYRSKAIIEPYLSKQWFVKMTAFKDQLINAVKSKQVELIPPHFEQTYFYWIEHLRDWCISRQLWWGHRIPIWYKKGNLDTKICYDGEGVPPEVQKNPEEWIQDEEVLDTWFSSAMWPFTVMGWPDKTKDMDKFFPNSLLITGHDILFFWVARMILMSEYCFKKVPFKQAYIHGLIYGKSYWRTHSDGSVTYLSYEEKKKYDLGDPIPNDVSSKWEKMSKSKGNVINPIEMIDEYGTDATRIALCSSVTFSRQIDLDRRRFEDYKNFANKLWNGFRFIFQHLQGNEAEGLFGLTREMLAKGLNKNLFSLEDRWILSRINRVIVEMNHNLENYIFDKAATAAYDFFWNEFCSYYLEMCKPVLYGKKGTKDERENKQKLLLIILGDVIRLLHPIAPFITEEIFSILKELFTETKCVEKADEYTKKTVLALSKPCCMLASYPGLLFEEDISDSIEKDFADIQEVIYSLRNLRAEMQIPPSQATPLVIVGKKGSTDWIEKNISLLSPFIRLENISFQETEKGLPAFFASTMVKGLKLIVILPKEFLEQEKKRLIKEEEKQSKLLESCRFKLSQSSFLEKAPESVIYEIQNTLKETEAKIAEIHRKKKQLG